MSTVDPTLTQIGDKARELFTAHIASVKDIAPLGRLARRRLLAWEELPEYSQQHWRALAYLNLIGENPDCTVAIDTPFKS